MAQRPFGYGNRALRDNYSSERAAPRVPGQGEKRYHHPVIPISSKTAPHYAQASQLYPMRTTSELDNAYRYKPGSGSLGPNGRPASPASPSGSTRQPISIPVHHLAPSRAAVTSPNPMSSGFSSPMEMSHSNPSTPTPPPTLADAMGDGGPFRTPSYRTTSVLTTNPNSSQTTPIRHLGGGGVRGQPLMTDQEAEVDALTNLLMQSMETRSSPSSGLGSIGSGLAGSEVSSTAGSHRRGSGPLTPINVNSQIGRLQQHLGLASSPVGGVSTNSGRGSPLNTGGPAVTSASVAGSSSTNSPTGSTTSVHNASEVGSVPGLSHTLSGANNTTCNSNSCFRCGRGLLPQDGTTLNSNVATANYASNIVTLTGALAARLHVACFTCYRCKAPLRPDAYYHSIRRLLCPACVRDSTVEHCSSCRRPIGERVVHALGMPYHPNCFVCVVCAGRLDSRPFTIDVHGRLHCLEDFHRRYAPRCADCGRPIVPEPGTKEARRVVLGDSNYHLECFGYHNLSQTNSSSTGSKLTSGLVS